MLSSASTKKYKFPNLNLVRALVIMYACSAIHLWPMPRFVFKFIQISVDGENIENHTKMIVAGKPFIRFRAKTPLSGLVWTWPQSSQFALLVHTP